MGDARWRAMGGDWPLIPRSQLEPLKDQLLASSSGVLLCGPPGIGKTCLANVVSEALGMPSLAIACSPGDSDIPLTALNLFLGSSDGLLPDSRESADQQARARLSEIGGGRTVLVVVDDVQWLDAASADVLASLARAGDAQLLCTARSVRNFARPLQRMLTDDVLRRVDLAGLVADEVVALLEIVLQGPVDHALAEELVEVTGGNALFVREATRTGLAVGGIAQQRGVWTNTGWRLPTGTVVADLVDAELDTVDPAHRPALELIALSGAIPRRAVLTALAPAGGPAGEVDEALDALEDVGIIETDLQSGEPELRVAHPLFAERVRLRTPTGRRQRLHRERYADVALSTLSPGDFLRWITWAVDSGMAVEPEQLMRAATSASALGQDRFALRMAESAVARCTEDDALLQVKALQLMAVTRLNRADREGARVDATAAAALLETAELPPGDRLVLQYVSHRIQADMQQFGDDDPDAAIATMQRFLDNVEGAEFVHDRVLGVARREAWRGNHAVLDDLLPLLEEGEGMPSPELLELVSPAMNHLVWRGETDRALNLSERHWGHAEASTWALPWIMAELESTTTYVLIHSGRLEAALELHERGRNEARRDHTMLRMGTSLLHAARGEWDRAWIEVSGALRTFASHDPSGSGQWAAAVAADIAAMGGHWADAARFLEIHDTGLTRSSRGLAPDAALHAVRAAFALGEESAAPRAEDLAQWAAGNGYDLVRLDALHLLGLAHPRRLREHLAGAPPLPDPPPDTPVAAALHNHVTAVADDDLDLARAAITELAKCGRWVPVGRQVPRLTRREREIAGLVSAGLTSPEIAERLHVSSRTVETHVSRVMGKLGVSRRSEVAAALAPRAR